MPRCFCGVILELKDGSDKMRILVVEDDRLLNHTLCYNLDAAGYTVDFALTKSAVSNFLTEQDCDMIVLDVNLPDGNGFDFCREVKGRSPDTAVSTVCWTRICIYRNPRGYDGQNSFSAKSEPAAI